ncbi:hypothetical protein C0989_011001 [Termitomyces sp. Mn162]|nr:hypothetical protein C0989_011001 [Termitomyces sp. Mn162]
MLRHIPILLVLAITPSVLAVPEPLDVSLPIGTFRGVSTPQGIEKWLGIRYAQAPVGSLRFKAPVPVPHASPGAEVVNASTFGNACPQLPVDNLMPVGAPIAEDCLFLNLGLGILQRSVTNQRPIVFVSINYRVNTFGFLASASVAPEDLNAGLLDQRLAFEFVQDNIAAFGGDPAKVTIWGQSAGAGSVEAHIIYATPRKLFRAGIADSSVGPLYTLLSISNAMIVGTLNDQLWQPCIGPPGSFAPVRASELIKAGQFRHDVAYLAGTNLNEGTTFSVSLLPTHPSTTSGSNTDFADFIRALLIDPSRVTQRTFDRLEELFPTTLRVPFATGNELFDRAEQWYTDEMFVAPRRLFFDHAAPLQSVFAYRFEEPIPGINITFGVPHASELLLLFLLPAGEEAVEDEFANTMLDMWLSFVNDMNPGDNWPRYTLENRSVMKLKRDNITVIPDDFDIEKTDFLNSDEVLDQFQK